jgi:DNA-directed RNA polymerase alpha subunit
MKLNEIPFSIRAQNAFRVANVKTIAELCDMTVMDLINIPGCGKKTIWEIKDVLENRGLHLKNTSVNYPFLSKTKPINEPQLLSELKRIAAALERVEIRLQLWKK